MGVEQEKQIGFAEAERSEANAHWREEDNAPGWFDRLLEEPQQEFEQQVNSVQDLAQERRRQLEEISSEAVGEVQQALVEIVTGMAEDKGFNIVLPSSQLLFFARQIDLTDEVLAKLDEKLPEVVVADRVD